MRRQKVMRGNRIHIYPTVVLAAVLSILFWAADVGAQSQAPVTGKYPGGHVGLRGGATPPQGFYHLAAFVRFQDVYALKDDNGNTVQSEEKELWANIWPFVWNTHKEILGGTWGGLAAVPFNETISRPYDLSTETNGFSLGDIVIAPWIIYYKWKEFDFQWGGGVWMPTGHFEPGGTHNHGNGYWCLLGSVGGVWYPGGDRRSWSVSAVARLEFNGKQKDTDIDVGDDIEVDWGVGKVFVAGGKSFPLVFDVGISGFAEWQVTSQSGPLPEDSTPKYRVYAIGPEIQLAIPKWKLGFLLRVQAEFGARNTTQANNLWFNVSYNF
jgi:hypothetical protein